MQQLLVFIFIIQLKYDCVSKLSMLCDVLNLDFDVQMSSLAPKVILGHLIIEKIIMKSNDTSIFY
jgi:hypothetical protein